jgi:NitT/TauT family transport system substrate-binding protein
MKKVALLCCILAALLSSCSHKSKRSEAQAPLQPLSLGVMATMDGFPFLVAADKGIYDSLGLKVNITIFRTETDRDASFEAHNLDGMVTDYSSAAVLQSKGIPLKVIMRNDGYLCLMIGRDSKINSIKKLQDINFCASPNSFAQYASEYILKKAGINTGRVNQPEISQIPLRLLMLQEGQIDATFLPDPYATIAMNSGLRSLITTQELNLYQMATAFSKSALKDKKASIDALIKGYNLAVDYLLSHTSHDWGDILLNQQVPENALGLIVLPPYQHAQRPDMNEINNVVNWLKEKKAVKDEYDGTELADTTFVEKFTVKIGKKKLWLHGRRRNK